MGQDMNIEGSGESRPRGESEAPMEGVRDEAQPEASFDAATPPGPAALPPSQGMPLPQSIDFDAATPNVSPKPPAATETQPPVYPPPGFGPPPGYLGPGYLAQPGYPPQPGFAPPGSYPPPPGFGPPGYIGPPPTPGPYGPPPGFGPPNGSTGYGPGAWPPGSGPAYGQPGFGYGPPFWAAPILAGPAPGLVWAGIGIRLAALVVDLVVELVVLLGGTAIADAAGYQSYGPNAGYSPPATIVLWMTLVLLAGYVPTCWWAFQGTIGQRALGLRVLRAADGLSLGLGATTVRYLIWLLCVWTVVIGVVVAIVASDKPDKRAWLDDASGSVVVRRV